MRDGLAVSLSVTTDAVSWQPWSAATFVAAQQHDRPILLSINGVWCYWCHEMDNGTYADAEVARFVNEHFTPILVDTDHRPDINARYNVGGWPTTSFLTPHGGYIAGATYLPPDQFLAMLDEVRRAYAERKPELYEQANDILRQRREHAGRVSAGRELEASLVDGITRRVAGTYDPRHGGFGVEPKFPSTPMLRLLLHQYRTTGEAFFRVMLEKSLDAMVNGALRDEVDGGFFRFVAGADWSQPQHEKMAEDNIALARIFMEGGIVLKRPDFTQIAGQTVDYLCGTLYHPEAAGVRGSQGAHSEYYGQPAQVRAQMPTPAVDPICYVSITAQAASLFFSAAWQLGHPELAGIAVSLLDRLVEMAEGSQLPHTYTADGPAHHEDGDLLIDWACFLTAALDGFDATAVGGERYLAAAQRAADVLLERFLDGARGGFWDIEGRPDRLGYLRSREKPLAENVPVALAMMRLQHATMEPRYGQTAHHTLSAYVDANRDYGELAADYAVAVDRYLNPVVEVTVEGQPGKPDADAMLAAAMTLTDPNLLIKLAEATHSDAPAQAHVCLDTLCYPPVSDPAALASAVAEGGVVADSPFQNVLDLLG
jgi:uncharacterized protein YyaL (SSP411 family)